MWKNWKIKRGDWDRILSHDIRRREIKFGGRPLPTLGFFSLHTILDAPRTWFLIMTYAVAVLSHVISRLLTTLSQPNVNLQLVSLVYIILQLILGIMYLIENLDWRIDRCTYWPMYRSICRSIRRFSLDWYLTDSQPIIDRLTTSLTIDTRSI